MRHRSVSGKIRYTSMKPGREGEERGRALDAGIVRAVWMTPDEVRATADRHRSPLILQCIEDWLGGKRHPLSLVHHH